MNLSDIKPKMRVIYVPLHANGDLTHPDVEHGTVSSANDKYAFVKFDRQLVKFGWDGTTSQSCDPTDLKEEEEQKAFPKTFTISPDGKSITCLHCQKTSHNPNDVENEYCGFCHVSHDSIWPPARLWWITEGAIKNPAS